MRGEEQFIAAFFLLKHALLFFVGIEEGENGRLRGRQFLREIVLSSVTRACCEMEEGSDGFLSLARLFSLGMLKQKVIRVLIACVSDI